MAKLDALFTPADFEALKSHDLSQSTCVVFDVLRATSSIVSALANGAKYIVPVGSIAEALGIRAKEPGVLLAGERDGLRIRADLTGGPDFDLGNSPREFTPDRVKSRGIVMTTTNGTRALRACAAARQVLVGSFLNLTATCDYLAKRNPSNLLLVCGGTFEEAAYEDVLAAGAVADAVWESFPEGAASDAALMARKLYLAAEKDLEMALCEARNGRRLIGRSELSPDVAFCANRDSVNVVALMEDDRVKVLE